MALADFVIFAYILTLKTENFNFSKTNDHKYPNVIFIKKLNILYKDAGKQHAYKMSKHISLFSTVERS